MRIFQLKCPNCKSLITVHIPDEYLAKEFKNLQWGECMICENPINMKYTERKIIGDEKKCSMKKKGRKF